MVSATLFYCDPELAIAIRLGSDAENVGEINASTSHVSGGIRLLIDEARHYVRVISDARIKMADHITQVGSKSAKATPGDSRLPR